MFTKLYLTLLAFSAIAIAQSPAAFVQNRASNLVLDVDGGSTQPGANIILWNRKSSGTDNQLWSHGGGAYLVNKNSGLVIEAPLAGGSLRPGTPLQQAPRRDGAANQWWIYDEQRHFVSAYDRRFCIWGLNGNVQNPGTNAVVDFCHDFDTTQAWVMVVA